MGGTERRHARHADPVLDNPIELRVTSPLNLFGREPWRLGIETLASRGSLVSRDAMAHRTHRVIATEPSLETLRVLQGRFRWTGRACCDGTISNDRDEPKRQLAVLLRCGDIEGAEPYEHEAADEKYSDQDKS